MPNIYLIEGPVGAGKSTFSMELSKRRVAPHLALDDWMVTLFQPDRPSRGLMEWYVERKTRCLAQIWKVAEGILASERDVILEPGLIQRQQRQDFYKQVDASGYPLIVYVLDVPKEIRRERVKLRNREKGATYSMEVSDDVFEMASGMWEPPDDIECEEREVRFVVDAASLSKFD